MDTGLQIRHPPPELLHLVARLYVGAPHGTGDAGQQGLEKPSLSPGVLASLQHRSEQSAACALLDRLPFGVLALDAKCRLRFENHSARCALDRADLLMRDDGHVRPWSDKDLPGFVQAAEGACRGQYWPPEGHEIRVEHRHWRIPIRLLGVRMSGAPASMMILLLPDIAREHSLRRLLMTMFALTVAETEVALLMMSGLSIEQAARRRGVLLATARGQWQSAQYKVGAGGEGGLIHVLRAALLLTPA